MASIYKYLLVPSDEIWVDMPPDSEVLSVGVQNGEMFLWAKVDDSSDRTQGYRFFVRGTGHPLTGEEGRFIGTVQMRGGSLIFHVFEG